MLKNSKNDLQWGFAMIFFGFMLLFFMALVAIAACAFYKIHSNQISS